MTLSPPSELEASGNSLIFDIGYQTKDVTRAIRPTYSSTRFGQAFEQMRQARDYYANTLARAFEESYKTSFPNLERTLADSIFDKSAELFAEQQVSWYLREFFTTVRRAHQSHYYSSYSITLKSCRDYSFYSLEGLKKGETNSTLLQTPFFVKTKPSSDEEKPVVGHRGLADILLMLSPDIMACKRKESMLFELVKWYGIKLDCEATNGNVSGSLELVIRPKVVLDKYIALPPEYHKILISSPNFRAAVSALSRIWSDPKAKSALLCGWTGSGKEVCVDLLMSAMRLSTDERIALAAPELRFSSFRATLLKKFNRKRAFLFLDEIHHSSAQDLREGLLRLMTAGRLEDSRGSAVDCSTIFYMLAASIPPAKARLLKPSDLWTRMQYTVTLHHPLLIKDRSERREILKDYFILFWTLSSNDWGTNESERNIASLLIDEAPLSHLSGAFADILSSPLIPLMSLRVLQSLVGRLFAMTVEHFREHLQGGNSSEVWSDVQRLFGDWIEDIFLELIPENGPGDMF